MTVFGWSTAFAITAMLAGWVGTNVGGRITGAYSDESGSLLVALVVAAAAGAFAGVLALRQRFMAGYRWVPVLLFVAMAAFMWTARGVHHGGDTPRYVGGAERLLGGEPLLGRDSAYVGYIAVVALFQTVGAGEAGIIAFQVLIAALCAAALFDMGRRVAGERAGVAAASLYAINVDLARFTFSILTDSLFTSGLLLSTYLTYRALAGGRLWAAPAAATALATGFLRPGGSFFVPIFGVALALAVLRERNLAWRGGAALAVLVASAGLNLGPVRAVYSTEDPMQWLVGGYVLIENEEYRMPMPPAGDSASSIEYCADWPVACARLVLRRVAVEFAHTRTFYSSRHNLLVWLTFPVLYAFAVIGTWASRRHVLTVLSVAVVGLQAALTGLTLADWDGRLVLFVFPLITLYSGVGIAVLASSYLARRRRFDLRIDEHIDERRDDHRSDDYWKKALPRWLVITMLRREQKKLYDRFAAAFPPRPDWRVLDVGTNGSLSDARDYFLHYYYPYPERITAAGLEPPDTFRGTFPGCAYVQVRRGEPLPFADQSFDLVFSNAVIEHVGSHVDQQAFLLELARVGTRAFVTTPNRWHPIEFHTATALIHYLPTPAYRRIYRALGFDFFAKEENLNLLDHSTLRSLLPVGVRDRAEIAAHRFLGIRSHLLLTLHETSGRQ